ncbi:E3 ubiquitin-protein ligase MARCHF1 isoform X2 [Manduca sexta]|uniref:RING-CH-type domain-containing protein n=1 Tax=Manduca sexta TaxID=7130 RepID=A0A921Z6D2_MANSE|nr:E3 ubiquitin-protein ligase MARCHF1 isoform X2 [Manduca sexta]KAG6451022.1 hypothetical protein O3G_MSEX006881 [Manduca sexta]
MDNQSELQEESTNEERKLINTNQEDNAGPSVPTLPGAVQSPKTKTGLSKSEHSIHLITTKDVTDALKSLNQTPQGIVNLNFNELKIPILEKDVAATDPTTLIDLKKFMASCFKFNKEGNKVIIETPNVHAVTITSEITEPNSSNDTQTESIPNEVLITAQIESKVSKAVADRKKSGSLSERSDLALVQRDSISSIGSNVCRICMTRGRERLISPCNCKGSLANVHLSCLERWLNQVGRNHCELCGFSYPAIRTPRYTVLQALRLWFGNPRNRNHLQSDCLIFWLLSTVTAGLLAVCIVGTQYFVIEGNKFGISHRITETAMDFFMAIVLCGYSVTVYLLWKDHYVMWNRWRRANVNVRLLLTPDSNPVPFVPRPRYNVV